MNGFCRFCHRLTADCICDVLRAAGCSEREIAAYLRIVSRGEK